MGILLCRFFPALVRSFFFVIIETGFDNRFRIEMKSKFTEGFLEFSQTFQWPIAPNPNIGW
ncbi:hypothetical protein BSK55_17515 [Paenibacillus odorifer]|nr:hypothetical protein BSK55_17515 [Paenibacillus odorifer]